MQHEENTDWATIVMTTIHNQMNRHMNDASNATCSNQAGRSVIPLPTAWNRTCGQDKLNTPKHTSHMHKT